MFLSFRDFSLLQAVSPPPSQRRHQICSSRRPHFPIAVATRLCHRNSSNRLIATPPQRVSYDLFRVSAPPVAPPPRRLSVPHPLRSFQPPSRALDDPPPCLL
ncbi:hypothetical protein HN873_071090 [Arachis hypogaea]